MAEKTSNFASPRGPTLHAPQKRSLRILKLEPRLSRFRQAWDHQLPADVARKIGVEATPSIPAIIDAHRSKMGPMSPGERDSVRERLSESIHVADQARWERKRVVRALNLAAKLEQALNDCLEGTARPGFNSDWVEIWHRRSDLAAIRKSLDRMAAQEEPAKRGPKSDAYPMYLMVEAWKAAGLKPGTSSKTTEEKREIRGGPFVRFAAVMHWVVTGEPPLMSRFGSHVDHQLSILKGELDGSG